MSEPLTNRQRQVLDFIEDCINSGGYPPTLREIGQHFKIRSTNGVNDHLKALQRKGYLTRGTMKSRALRPVTGTGQTVEIPLLGRVAAGQPMLAVEDHEATVRIDRFFIGNNTSEVFALRVQGDSMIEDGIYDGDFIFVTKRLSANPGDMVVFMVDGEATVKRFYNEPEHVRLQPANEAMDPILVPHAQYRSVDLIGVVVGMYRKVH